MIKEMSEADRDRLKVPEWIEEACEANGRWPRIYLASWNRRFRRRLGDANAQTGAIRLSARAWPKLTSAQRREVVIHEACHIIAFDKFGTIGLGHGPAWRDCMQACGYPNASGSMRTDFSLVRYYEGQCFEVDCRKVLRIGPGMFRKAQRAQKDGLAVRCPGCKTGLPEVSFFFTRYN